MATSSAVNLGLPNAYLDGDRIIEAAQAMKCAAIHPGYGFLSENSDFARKCGEAGLIFIGPPWTAIEAMGSKSESKNIMTAAGVPCVPGYHGSNQDPDFLEAEAKKIGFPVLLKAIKGGGGKGMRIVRTVNEFQEQLTSAKSEAQNSFGDEAMLVERYITTPRHIEVQVFADKHGNCVALGERDCSIQRRHQKVLEESPAPHLDPVIRHDLWAKARAAALAVGYEGAGTVEFIFDNDSHEFFFMEMNTRLQVEHPVTEMITGEDLVHWQFAVAEGRTLPLSQDEIEHRIEERGWAMEARIYAENPNLNFIPDAGLLTHIRTPPTSDTLRIDAGFVQGDQISSYYDPMIAKLIVRAPTRDAAALRLQAALEEYEVAGVATNIDFLQRICADPDFVDGKVQTGFIEEHHDKLFASPLISDEVLAQAALVSLLQDIQGSSRVSRVHHIDSALGFGPSLQQRRIALKEKSSNGQISDTENSVLITQLAPGRFDVEVNESRFQGVTCSLDGATRRIISFYPHARLVSTFVCQGNSIELFQGGQHYRLECVVPRWHQRALGVKDISSSVLAPMPCKVLRVMVSKGARIQRHEPLVVIESMKMETIIRSPQDGVISAVMHAPGDMCAAGTALVEFETLAGDAPTN
ncbi:MAG: hypothetical protein M1817_000852 [Caeruleum heppii]|nr:MAG: hypothetical protein M1817_000852 [Caeruleum heppii]